MNAAIEAVVKRVHDISEMSKTFYVLYCLSGGGGVALRLMFCTGEYCINIPMASRRGGGPARQSLEYFCYILNKIRNLQCTM